MKKMMFLVLLVASSSLTLTACASKRHGCDCGGQKKEMCACGKAKKASCDCKK